MATIVEYSTAKRAVNAHPRKIISPPFSSPCCPSSIKPIGALQEEWGWPFVYYRCRVRGFTVRRFTSREEVVDGIRRWRKAGKVIPTPDAAWQNLRRKMNMTKQFDLIVIGTGAAGATAAYKCRSAGWEVAIFAVAIRTGLRADDLKTIPYAYPSSASDISYMV